MNRRELLGAVGSLGTLATLGATLGAGTLLAAPRAHASDHPMLPGAPKTGPVANHDLHFCGIHCAKKDPRIQIVTQHYCGMIGDGMHQCLLFDATSPGARLLGVEYIIPDAHYRALPDIEKRYWHPHSYEVLSGGLVAPTMKPDDELAFMKGLLTTWGKTWHTWPDPTTAVPMGEPLLMWSLTADGQDAPNVVATRDRALGISTARIREQRRDAIGFEVPTVPQPHDLDAIGRQWTASGPDRPTPKK